MSETKTESVETTVKHSPATVNGNPTEISKAATATATDECDIIIPSQLLGRNSGECTVLVQIDPTEAAALALDGATGAVGRLEADSKGCTSSFKSADHVVYDYALCLISPFFLSRFDYC